MNRSQFFSNQCGAVSFLSELVSFWLQIVPSFATNSNAHPTLVVFGFSPSSSLLQTSRICLNPFMSIGVGEIRCRDGDGKLYFHIHSRKETCFYIFCILICNGIATWARQICEQLVFEVCIPPFTLRLAWCSRFASKQRGSWSGSSIVGENCKRSNWSGSSVLR